MPDIFILPDGIQCLFQTYQLFLQNNTVDLILMDQNMPFLNGNVICSLIKSMKELENTYIYSITSTKTTIANTIKMLCRPLVLFNINIEEIEIMVAISLSIIPILKKDLVEIRDVYKYKGIKVNVKNIKNSLSVFFIGIIKRTNQIDEALIARGKKY